jgi:hypothetical protein
MYRGADSPLQLLAETYQSANRLQMHAMPLAPPAIKSLAACDSRNGDLELLAYASAGSCEAVCCCAMIIVVDPICQRSELPGCKSLLLNSAGESMPCRGRTQRVLPHWSRCCAKRQKRRKEIQKRNDPPENPRDTQLRTLYANAPDDTAGRCSPPRETQRCAGNHADRKR